MSYQKPPLELPRHLLVAPRSSGKSWFAQAMLDEWLRGRANLLAREIHAIYIESWPAAGPEPDIGQNDFPVYGFDWFAFDECAEVDRSIWVDTWRRVKLHV